MALTKFYVQQTGSNLNAGSTQDDAPLFSYIGTWDSANTRLDVTSGTDPLSDGISAGMFVSLYTTASATQAGIVARVTSVTSNRITISTTVMAGSTSNLVATAGATTLRVGGAWAGPSGSVGFPFGFVTNAIVNTNNDPVAVYFKKGSSAYTITAGMAHALAGPVIFEGYETTVGDNVLAEFDARAGAPIPILTLTAPGNCVELRNFWFHGNFDGTDYGSGVGTGNGLIIINARATKIHRCYFSDAWRCAIQAQGGSGGGGHIIEYCTFKDNQCDDASALATLKIEEECAVNYCLILNSGANKFANRPGDDASGVHVANDFGETVTFNHCVIAGSTGRGVRTDTTTNVVFNHCAFVNNGTANAGASDGIDLSATTVTSENRVVCNYSIFWDNIGYGIRNDAVGRSFPHLNYCAFGGNSIGATLNCNDSFENNRITLTENPFNDPDNFDFSLNSAPGGGALLRGAAVGAFLGLSTGFATLFTNRADVGPHQTTPEGGRGSPVMRVGGNALMPIY